MFVENVFESDISVVMLDLSLSMSVPGIVLLNLAMCIVENHYNIMYSY